MEGAFKTVASVRGATSASWLATLEPVRTGKVRLLVTRSAGPTDHTDVWEMEVYGRPLSAGEMQAYLAARLEAAEAGGEAAMKSLQTISPQLDELPKFVREAAERLQASLAELRLQSERWDQMDGDSRGALIRQADQTAALAARWRERSSRFQGMARSRLSALAKAREEQSGLVKEARQAGLAVADMGTEQSTLASDRLFVSVDLRTGVWNAVWAEGTDVAIFGARFSVETGQSNIIGNGGTASVFPVRDALGKGRELRQVWQAGGVRVERELRVYDSLGVLTIGGRIFNESDAAIRLGTIKLIDVSNGGWWWLGQAWELPAAVYIQGHSLLRTAPFTSPVGLDSPAQRSYHSSGVLMLTSRDPRVALTIGYVRADEASPDVAANFRLDEGGVSLAANSRFLGRVLGPRETVELNRLYLLGGADPFQSLEAYGDAMAKFSAQPVRTGPTSLWCSWYAHRMGMTEEKVLANAAVAAKHFKPLGFEIMQLDHGWQRGDVTGDWVPNERFPHGLKWLADQLRERYGLRLGVWISPTDVAETSDVFKRHPEWLLKGADGKPRVNWRWYWAPNPNCYELDATHPGAFQFIENSFRQLTQWGVSYYKIDFIASAAGEHFIPHDPKTARGWPVLRRAMEAVRRGAGDAAWIRFCQTPPLLSAGLANSAYGGNDTLDAGIPGRFDVLRDNAHALAAGYWLNDRPYHREVCDMSVRMQGSVEETRVRAAIMTLANCSISWSDELCYLPPSRIRLMQQCLPPGNPPMKPLDLFQRDVPSVWHIRVKNEAETWDVVGLFNFGQAAEPRAVRFDQLGLEPGRDCAVFEFWEEKFLGLHQGGIEVLLPPESSRILSIRKVTGGPQLIGTDMHLLQGYHEIKKLAWDVEKGLLSGSYRRMPGLEGKAFFYLPEGYYPKFDFPLSSNSARLTHVEGPIWVQEFQFAHDDFTWSIPIEAPKKPPGKEPNG
ncbi:MAG: glycoside hydrolase family 36 protein [Verrucomicrobiota bacterium]